MNGSFATAWWVVAGILVVAELTTGTFYLLMLALGAAAGALASHLGLGLNLQLLAAALVGGGAVAGWHWLRPKKAAGPPAAENRDVNLDIGEQVQVSAWQPDGSATVSYRGSQWAVRHAGGGVPSPGLHVIRRVEGNRLYVERAA